MTQCERIEEYIDKHGSITTMEAFNLGITRLSARIKDLEERGKRYIHQFEVSKNRHGQTVHYTRYKKVSA